MDWLYALLGILMMIVIALLLGWTHKNVKSPTLYACVWIGSILLLLAFRFELFHWTPVLSYIPHSVETSISVDENWIVGETKECKSYPLISRVAPHLGKEPGYAAGSLHCDDGPMHTVRVTFYGRLNQPEHKIAYWQCTRNPEAFTCRQTRAE